MAGISYFHDESLQVLPSGRLLMWWLDPLFTDMTGNLFFSAIFWVEEKACTSLQFMYATDMYKGQRDHQCGLILGPISKKEIGAACAAFHN